MRSASTLATRCRLRALGLAALLTAGPLLALGGGELGHPIVRSFPPGQSRLGLICQAVVQDRWGFMYLGNFAYLRFFDGEQWRLIKTPPESTGIRKFAVTPDGTIFAGGAGIIGYLRGAGEAAEFVSLAGKLPPSELGCDEIFDVLAAGDAVYFADEEKILIWRDGRFTVVPCRSPAHSHGAQLFAAGGVIYAVVPDRGLCRIEHDRLETVADDALFRQNRIVLLESGPDGALVALTESRGFFEFAAGQARPLALEANRWLAGQSILRAQRSADGSLAVVFTAPSGDGGMRFDPAGRYVGPIDRTIGLYTPAIRDLFYDREGGLWLGAEVGLFRLEWPSPVTVFDAVNGLGSGAVADVVRHEGVLYAATSEGVFQLAPGDESGRVARFERVLNQPAYALVSHPAGLLALGYAHLFVRTAAGLSAVADIPPGGGTLRQSTRDPNRVWIGTTHGIQSVRMAGTAWRDEGLLPGFDENVRGLAEAADGALWAATFERGLYRADFAAGDDAAVRPARVEHWGAERGVPGPVSRLNIVEGGDGPVVLVNAPSQALRFDSSQARFVPVAEAGSLPATGAEDGWSASDDRAGAGAALWLANSGGIYRVSREAGVASRALSHVVTAAAGAISRMRQETIDGDDVLWICGSNGLVRVEVARAFAAPVPFATVLNTPNVREGERLPPDHGALHFNYRALRHQLGDNLSYQTRLVGRDSGWSPWSPETARDFASLSAGRYRFEVRARDANGVLGSPAAISFTVLSPWWLTPWAVLGYVTAGGGLVAGVVGGGTGGGGPARCFGFCAGGGRPGGRSGALAHAGAAPARGASRTPRRGAYARARGEKHRAHATAPARTRRENLRATRRGEGSARGAAVPAQSALSVQRPRDHQRAGGARPEGGPRRRPRTGGVLPAHPHARTARVRHAGGGVPIVGTLPECRSRRGGAPAGGHVHARSGRRGGKNPRVSAAAARGECQQIWPGERLRAAADCRRGAAERNGRHAGHRGGEHGNLVRRLH